MPETKTAHKASCTFLYVQCSAVPPAGTVIKVLPHYRLNGRCNGTAARRSFILSLAASCKLDDCSHHGDTVWQLTATAKMWQLITVARWLIEAPLVVDCEPLHLIVAEVDPVIIQQLHLHITPRSVASVVSIHSNGRVGKISITVLATTTENTTHSLSGFVGTDA